MSNSGIIAFGKAKNSTSIYLHWNGGIESIMAFLQCGKDYGVGDRPDYAPARMCQIIGNFMDKSVLSLGIYPLDKAPGTDHDVVRVDEKLNIVFAIGHEYEKGITTADLSPTQLEHYHGVYAQCKLKNDHIFLEQKDPPTHQQTYLDLSTAYLSKETMTRYMQDTSNDGVLAKYPHGAFAYIATIDDDTFIPDDLQTVMKYAEEKGYSLIRFDADGSKSCPELPMYDGNDW